MKNPVDSGPQEVQPAKKFGALLSVDSVGQGRFHFLLSFLLASVCALLCVAIICGLLYEREAQEIAAGQLDRENRRCEIYTHFVEQDLREVTKDLAQLADGDGLQAYLLSGQQADLNRALHRGCLVSRLNPDYDQVRFIDETGQEVIRINGGGVTVPREQLQNKADRSYFQKASLLSPGQIFISAFDLNVENGQVEQPIKPMVRLATPVFDTAGKRRGIYIINDLGANILARLQNFVPQYGQRLRMLNSHGYWLKAGSPNQEWGSLLPERAGQTMAMTDPSLWAQISSQPAGQVYHGGGVFSWNRALPGNVGDHKFQTVAEDDYLVIAMEITPREWNDYFSGLRQTFILVASVLFVVLLASWRFFDMRQRAQRERDRFFTLTRDMLCMASFDGYFRRVNPAWTACLGYTGEELQAVPFIEFVHPEDKERTRLESARLSQGHETASFENRYRCKDGSYRWLLWSARSLPEERIIFASARDMTDRKRTEEEILELNRKLVSHTKQMEVANKELEAFSYSVSHDLRAPLRHIHGFVELLQKSPALQGEESSRRYMNVIARAGREMGILIDDLLSFSRTGRAEMQMTKVDMRDLVDHTIRNLEIDIRGREIRWEIHPLPPVSCDANLLRLVWMNLLGNALKFTRSRPEAVIEIGAATDKEPGEIVFFVKDNGVGFDSRYADKLFGVFQRLHRAEDFEGTGIGLANVQRIIHRHGGRVWAESELGAGATFSFALPSRQPDVTRPDAQN